MLKSLIRLGIISCLLGVVSNVAQAQSSNDDILTLDVFTVTGSNIQGIDTEKSLPVSLFDEEIITESGFGSMSELVESMPYSTNLDVDETATGPNDARGDVSSINLRNLGSGRTLVLVNGRRMSAYGVTPGTPPVQFVNTNAIPFAAIQQVEILRDGASSIYGSDAMGGVVNTILRKDYTGAEARLRMSFGDPGPNEVDFSLSKGFKFNGGDTRLSFFFNWYTRDDLAAADREYAADANKNPLFTGHDVSFDRSSSSSPYGRFTAVDDDGNSVAVSGVTASNGRFYMNSNTGETSSGTGPSRTYNSQDGSILLPEIERKNLLMVMEHDLTDTLTFFAELTFYDSESSGGFAEIPISSSTDGAIIASTNYWSPVGVNSGAETPANVLIRNLRILEAGPRTYDTEADSLRLLAGLEGYIANTNWKWESAVLYMRGKTTQTNHNYISQSLFEANLALNSPDAYNPFNVGSNPQSVLDQFVIDIWDDGVGTLTTWDFKTSGELIEIPGGAVSMATGVEYRSETMEQNNDPFGLNDDVIAQSEQIDVDADRDVYSGYVELLIPIVGETNKIPLVESLELRTSVRYEHYSKFDATKPGVSLAWRPTDWLLLRSSYNEGFRAPSIVELFTPAIGRRNTGIIDTAREGQPDAENDVSKRVVTGGNTDLDPEESESYNYGIVLDLPFLKGFTVGADFFKIKQMNQIDNSDAEYELDLDAELWEANGGSNPRVVREAQTAEDIANGLPGKLVEVYSTYQNLTLREIEGWDFFANYMTPQWSFGRFKFTSMLTYTDSLKTIDENGNESLLVRNNGNPRVKATVGVNWMFKDLTVSLRQRYTSDYMASSSYTIDGERYVVDEYSVTNASVAYSFEEGFMKDTRVRVGVNNLFDEDPPFYPASSAGYNSSYSDPRGRIFYFEIARRF